MMRGCIQHLSNLRKIYTTASADNSKTGRLGIIAEIFCLWGPLYLLYYLSWDVNWKYGHVRSILYNHSNLADDQ